MAETLTIRTASSTEVVKIAVPGPQGPKGDKGDPGDVAGLPLTTLGDTLYRGASENQRLPIGTSGQILKVSAQGLPTWANESGAVSSVAGKTGVVTLDKNDVGLGNVANTAQVTSVTGTAPIVSSGGTTPAISVTVGTTANTVCAGNDARLSDSRTPLSHTHSAYNDIQNAILEDPATAFSDLVSALSTDPLDPSGSVSGVLGSGQGTLYAVSDFAAASHAAAHAAAGSDPLFDQDLNTADNVTFNEVTTDNNLTVGGDLIVNNAVSIGDNGIDFTPAGATATIGYLGLGTAATADIGTGSTEVAAGDHGHGNLTSDGKLGSVSGLPVVTTTAGAVTTLALGTANQVLRVNSGATGVEFADPSGGGVSAVNSTLADILSVSGSDLVADDLGADKLYGFDDSEGKAIGFTIGSGLSVSGDTISGFDAASPSQIGNTAPNSGAFTTLSASTSLTLGTSGILSGGTNLIEQRNGTSAQTFRLYNTVSGAADVNFELGFLSWSSNVFRIGTSKGGTGSARTLEFQTDSVTRLTLGTGSVTTFNGNSSLTIDASSNAALFGGSGAARIDAIRLSIATGGAEKVAISTGGDICLQSTSPVYWQSRTRLSSPADSRLLIQNQAANDFDRLQFGGTTSSFPALKRSSTSLQVRLADDSAFAPFECAGLTLNGNLTASTRNIVTDTTTGTRIGTGTTQLLGFWNATPAAQPAAVADATDAATTQARLNDLLARLRTIGIIAT